MNRSGWVTRGRVPRAGPSSRGGEASRRAGPPATRVADTAATARAARRASVSPRSPARSVVTCTGRRFGARRWSTTGTRPSATDGPCERPKKSCTRASIQGGRPIGVLDAGGPASAQRDALGGHASSARRAPAGSRASSASRGRPRAAPETTRARRRAPRARRPRPPRRARVRPPRGPPARRSAARASSRSSASASTKARRTRAARLLREAPRHLRPGRAAVARLLEHEAVPEQPSRGLGALARGVPPHVGLLAQTVGVDLEERLRVDRAGHAHEQARRGAAPPRPRRPAAPPRTRRSRRRASRSRRRRAAPRARPARRRRATRSGKPASTATARAASGSGGAGGAARRGASRSARGATRCGRRRARRTRRSRASAAGRGRTGPRRRRRTRRASRGGRTSPRRRARPRGTAPTRPDSSTRQPHGTARQAQVPLGEERGRERALLGTPRRAASTTSRASRGWAGMRRSAGPCPERPPSRPTAPARAEQAVGGGERRGGRAFEPRERARSVSPPAWSSSTVPDRSARTTSGRSKREAARRDRASTGGCSDPAPCDPRDPRAAPPTRGGLLRREPREAAPRRDARGPLEPAVDHGADPLDRQGGLGDVRRQDHLAPRRRRERRVLLAAGRSPCSAKTRAPWARAASPSAVSQRRISPTPGQEDEHVAAVRAAGPRAPPSERPAREGGRATGARCSISTGKARPSLSTIGASPQVRGDGSGSRVADMTTTVEHPRGPGLRSALEQRPARRRSAR